MLHLLKHGWTSIIQLYWNSGETILSERENEHGELIMPKVRECNRAGENLCAGTLKNIGSCLEGLKPTCLIQKV